jgi:peptidyl-prolyl cis-trans isomerase C
MASSTSRGPLTAIIVVVVAAAAAGAGYYFGSHATPGAAGGSSVSIAAAPSKGGAGAIVAKVNGTPIYQSEVDAFVRDLGDQAQQMAPAELQARVIDHLIDVRLGEAKAKEMKIDRDPDVAMRINAGMTAALAEAYMQQAAKAQINDTVLKAKYDELVAKAKPNEEVRARHILVKTEAEAKDIIKQLDKGADFEKLAAEKSDDPGSKEGGGDLGYFTKDKMVPEFADAAFKLDKGKYTETPVHSQYGWHVIQVLDKRSQPLPSFDQVKPQLTGVVMQQEEGKIMEGLRKTAKIERFNADGTPITDAPAAAPAAPAAAPAPAPAPAPAAPAGK